VKSRWSTAPSANRGRGPHGRARRPSLTTHPSGRGCRRADATRTPHLPVRGAPRPSARC